MASTLPAGARRPQTAAQALQVLFGGIDCHTKHTTTADDIEFVDAQLRGLVMSLSCRSIIYERGQSGGRSNGEGRRALQRGHEAS